MFPGHNLTIVLLIFHPLQSLRLHEHTADSALLSETAICFLCILEIGPTVWFPITHSTHQKVGFLILHISCKRRVQEQPEFAINYVAHIVILSEKVCVVDFTHHW